MTHQAIETPVCNNPIELGELALAARHVTEAVACFNQAESAGCDPDYCASQRWHCWMLLGEFERAWQESDSIARRGSVDTNRLWDGTDFSGKRLIVRCLHGFGDAIQFIRYVEFVHRRAASVTVETHGELVSLFSRLPYVDQVVTWADGSSKGFIDWDVQIEVMELPRAFRTTLKTIPAIVPYITVSETAKEQSRRLLGIDGPATRVGLVWSSSGWNPARSIPISKFALLARVPGISFYSFQRGPKHDELQLLREETAIHDTAPHSPNILDTAADLMNMDLLITVDTMAAHLAGALGIPVWNLLPFEADWRWMLDEDSTPWYPSMTLFRQRSPGDWPSVMEAVIPALVRFSKRGANTHGARS